MIRRTLLISALSLLPKPAAALSCAEPERIAHTLPPEGAVVASNTRPMLLLNPAVPSPVRPAVSVVCANERGDPSAVAVDVRVSGGQPAELMELVPRAALPVGASCAVVGDERRILTWFSIADRVDERAPVISGMRAARIHASGWDGALARASIRLAGVFEDHGTGTLLAGIWIGDNENPIDYSRDPATWAVVRRAELFLNEGGDCKEPNFAFPDLGEPEQLIGVRLVDPAGNRSVPVEARVEPFSNRWQASETGSITDGAFVRPLLAVPEHSSRTPFELWLTLLVVVGAASWALCIEREPR